MKKLLKREKFQEEDLPIRVLIGTCPGGKKDAEAMARAMVDRHFDIPGNAWFYLKAAPGIGTHYEIQEGGNGKAYLPSVLRHLHENDDRVVIRPLNARNVEVFARDEGQLQSVVLPEAQSEGAITAGIERSRQMIPVATNGLEWVKVGAMAFSLGLLTLTASGLLDKGLDMASRGYYEAANNVTALRIAQLIDAPSDVLSQVPSDMELPLSQWDRVEQAGRSLDRYVTRLRYEHGRWDVDTGSISAPQARDADADEPYLYDEDGEYEYWEEDEG